MDMNPVKPQVAVSELIRRHQSNIEKATPVTKLSAPAAPSQTALSNADVFTKGGQSYYSAYKGEATFRLKQSVYLDNKDPSVKEGVCRAASMHWLDRGLRGKEGLASSKHGPVPARESGAAWSPRLDDKVTKRWIPVQKHDDANANAKSFGLKMDKHEAIVQSKLIEDLSSTGLYVKGTQGEVLHDPQMMAERLCGALEPNKSYLLTLKGTPTTAQGAPPVHVVALRTGKPDANDPDTPSKVQLFDPNIGEFAFDSASTQGQQRMVSFFKDWTQSDLSRSDRGSNTLYGLGLQTAYLTEVSRA